MREFSNVLRELEKKITFFVNFKGNEINSFKKEMKSIPLISKRFYFFWFISLRSFHYINRNVSPIILRNGDGKNSQFVTQGTFQFPCASQFFPILGSAVVVKKNFPIHGFAAHGEIYLHHSCSAKYYVPFVIHGEIFFLLSWLCHSRGKFPSLFLHIKRLGHCH